MTARIVIEVSRDGWTGGLQLSIAQLDESDAGSGYRLAGPKFNGSGEILLRHTLDERDVAEIRKYLNEAFPTADEPGNGTGGGHQPYAGESTQNADFFQPGHTYRSPVTPYTAPELILTFRVEHVTRHPEHGHLRAIGWSHTGAPGARWHGDFRDEGEFDDWTEATTTTGDHA